MTDIAYIECICYNKYVKVTVAIGKDAFIFKGVMRICQRRYRD